MSATWRRAGHGKSQRNPGLPNSIDAQHAAAWTCANRRCRREHQTADESRRMKTLNPRGGGIELKCDPDVCACTRRSSQHQSAAEAHRQKQHRSAMSGHLHTGDNDCRSRRHRARGVHHAPLRQRAERTSALLKHPNSRPTAHQHAIHERFTQRAPERRRRHRNTERVVANSAVKRDICARAAGPDEQQARTRDQMDSTPQGCDFPSRVTSATRSAAKIPRPPQWVMLAVSSGDVNSQFAFTRHAFPPVGFGPI